MKRLAPVQYALAGLFCVLTTVGAEPSSLTLLFERGAGCIGDLLSLRPENLYSIRADGSELRQVTRDGVSTEGKWSPDGRRIVFTKGNGSCTSAFQSDLYVMRADGSQIRRLTRDGVDSEGSFSPDGTKLVFVQWFSFSSIVVSDTNGKHRRAVVKGGGAAWSPDGRRLLYGSGNVLWVVDLATSRKRRVAGGTRDSVHTGVWSPEGSWIVFPRDSGRNRTELWLTRGDGSARRQLTREPTAGRYDTGPAWSPDGKQIGYTRCDDRGCDLVRVSVDGRRQQILVHANQAKFSPSAPNPPDVRQPIAYPAWSPDGSLIAFTKGGNGRSSLWTVHPDGSTARQLTNSRAPIGALVWRP